MSNYPSLAGLSFSRPAPSHTLTDQQEAWAKRGAFNRDSIAQGNFPPKRKAPEPRALPFVPIEGAALYPDPISGAPTLRASKADDTDARVYGPDVVFNDRLAAFSEQHDGMDFPQCVTFPSKVAVSPF